MGHYLIRYGEINGMHGANGFHVLNPKTIKEKLARAHEMTDKSALINLERRNYGNSLPEEILITVMKMTPKLGPEYYTRSFAQSNAPEELKYEEAVWGNLRKILDEADLKFEIKHPKEDTVYCVLQVFLSGSELNFEGYETLRLYKKSLGNKIGEFFSGKSNGETLAMFSKDNVKSIRVNVDHIIFKLGKNKEITVYWNQAFGEK